MRAVVQRVARCEIRIDGEVHSRIGRGLLVLLGVEVGDTEQDVQWLAGKISKLRIFADEAGHMNLSVADAVGEMMVVSQFTLHAAVARGNRPSFIRAAAPAEAVPLYEKFLRALPATASGVFGADMQVVLCNDGPVTIIIDTRNRE